MWMSSSCRSPAMASQHHGAAHYHTRLSMMDCRRANWATANSSSPLLLNGCLVTGTSDSCSQSKPVVCLAVILPSAPSQCQHCPIILKLLEDESAHVCNQTSVLLGRRNNHSWYFIVCFFLCFASCSYWFCVCCFETKPRSTARADLDHVIFLLQPP